MSIRRRGGGFLEFKIHVPVMSTKKAIQLGCRAGFMDEKPMQLHRAQRHIKCAQDSDALGQPWEHEGGQERCIYHGQDSSRRDHKGTCSRCGVH